MAKQQDHQASNLFATVFAGLLGQTLTSACGSEWKIALAEPPSETLPVIESPVHYRLDFAQGLSGGCYVIFGQADVVVFGGQGQAQKGAEDGCTEALLALIKDVVASLPAALADDHGPVTIEAAFAPEIDAKAEHGLELRAKDAEGAATIILLRLDATLLDSLAMLRTEAAQTTGLAGGLTPANLEMVMDVELNCTLRFGQRQLSLREILDLASGSVVELDRQVDEPVELILDGKVIARGEAVVIDGNYGLRVTQVVQTAMF